jgi:hypothetical protein
MNSTPSQKNILMIVIALIIVECIYIAYTMPNSCPTQAIEMPHVENFGGGGGHGGGGHGGGGRGGGGRGGGGRGSWGGRGGWGRRRGNWGAGYWGFPYYYGYDYDYPIVGATCEASTKYSPCSTLRPIKVGYDGLGAGYATEWQCCSS